MKTTTSYRRYRVPLIFVVVFDILFLAFSVVFLFLVVIFFIRLFSKQDVGAGEAIVGVSIEAFSAARAHAT